MQDILNVIEDQKETYLQWLVQLCQQPSIATQNIGMVETAHLTERLLQGAGIETQQIETPGFPIVYGQVGQGDKVLSFYNHYDVQPPEPLELWNFPPFAAEIHDGMLYARGVSDNKGNIIARLAAVDAYQKARGPLPLQVKFIIEGEEEIGSPNLEHFVRHHPDLVRADGCIWEAGYTDPNGRPAVSLGVKGMLYVELTARQANIDLHSSWGTIVPNAAWYLLQALQTLRDSSGRVLIPGFYDAVLPPVEADNEALRQMQFDAESYRQQFGLNAFKNDISGLELLQEHLFQPTCTICGLWSGYTGPGTKTVLPAEARVKLDFRLVPNQDPQQILEMLQNHLARQGFSDIQIDVYSAEHPARTAISHPFAALVTETAREVYGKAPVVYPIMAGTGPMHVLSKQIADIPTVSIGVGNSDSRNHAPNENIYVTDFYDGIAHVAAILSRF